MIRNKIGRRAGLLLSSFGVLILLAACSSATVNPAPAPSSTIPTTNIGGVNQPKVVRTTTDTTGTKIEFTEPPMLNDGVPAFLWFETATWPQWAQMRPVVYGLKQKYSNQIKFADLDYTDKTNQALIQQFKVNVHPFFVLVDGKGNQIKRWVGVTAENELDESLKQLTNH